MMNRREALRRLVGGAAALAAAPAIQAADLAALAPAPAALQLPAPMPQDLDSTLFETTYSAADFDWLEAMRLIQRATSETYGLEPAELNFAVRA